MRMPRTNKKGIGFVEALVYMGLLGMIAVLVANFLMQTIHAYSQAKAEREVLSNARLLIEAVGREIADAREVYAPTSRFFSDTGQLSLITERGKDAEHTGLYLDFWAADGFLYRRGEGQEITTLSSATVRVRKFYFERIVQKMNREAIKITIQVDWAGPKYTTSTTLNSTIALRGNY